MKSPISLINIGIDISQVISVYVASFAHFSETGGDLTCGSPLNFLKYFIFFIFFVKFDPGKGSRN